MEIVGTTRGSRWITDVRGIDRDDSCGHFAFDPDSVCGSQNLNKYELVSLVMLMHSRRGWTDSCGSSRYWAAPRYVAWILEICLFLALACSHCAASGSDRTIGQLAHTTWGPKDGAPSSVTSLAQTPDGYLWVGGTEGLYRFDGVIFEHYQPQSGGPFPPGSVSQLLALPNGDLWIVFRTGGICLLRNGFATIYTARDGVPAGAIWGLAQDREGTIWAAAESGLSRLEGRRWKDVGKDWNFPGKSALAIFLDREGALWVATEETLVFLPPGARSFHPSGIPVGEVTQIAQAASGKLWMAEASRSVVRPFPLSDKRLSADKTEVQVSSQGILFDNDGALWITTEGDGLRRSPAPELLRGRIEKFSTAVESFTTKDGLSDDYVRAILQDREGNIWIATTSGLDRFRKTNLVPVIPPFKERQVVLAAGKAGDAWVEYLGSVAHVDRTRAEPGDPIPGDVRSAYRAPSGVIWWLGWDAIYRFDAGKYTRIALPPSFPRVNTSGWMAATEDRSGALWLTALREGIFYRKNGQWQQLESASEFARLTPRTAFTDWMGRAWFGYEGGTMVFLDQEKIKGVFPADASPVGSVRSINGRGRHMWVGGSQGLAFFDGYGFRRIVPEDAKTFGSVMGIEETLDGSLWLAESRGVVHIPASEAQHALDNPSYHVKYRLFDSFDGLSGTFAATGAFLKEIQGTDGGLWFFAWGGIVHLDPANISTNTIPPPVLIRSVRANGKQSGSLTNLVLPPGTTNLQIDYSAFSLSVPEKMRFRYRLEGVDKDWQDVGTRREAFYNSLGPGKYHFRVIACNNDGVWNEVGAHLDFNIAPAWYQTIWFRGLYVLAFFTLLWAGYRMRIYRLQEKEKIFREAIETMPAMSWIAGPCGAIQFRNRRWVEYTGLSQIPKLKELRKLLIHPEDLDRSERRLDARYASGDPFEEEMRIRRADGEFRWFLSRAMPLRDKRGKVVKWYGVATDIQDHKRAEQLQTDFAHTNRVSTMGELVASISHELAQPLTVTTAHAKASLRWLQRNPPNLTEVRKGTERIIEAGTLASEIIDRLRSLYKKSPPKRELIAINEVIGEMAKMLRTEARRHGMSLRTDLKDDLPTTVADRVQIQQVLMNLMLNGIEAMKDTGGVLTVKSQSREDGQIEISVSDTGPGLPIDKADQIFDAFFTTKPQGSGMGLAISKSIVESQGGRIWANGDSGLGATFHFTLPAGSAETNPPVDAT
jgi:PAS domain S-box-containing protein